MKVKHKILNSILVFSIIFWYYSSVYGSERIISKITPRFCNDREVTTKLFLGEVDVGSDQEICLAVLNSAEVPLNIKMYFVDSMIEEATWNTNCRWINDEKKWMAKYVSFPVDKYNNLENESDIIYFKIGPWETIEKRAKLDFPEYFMGSSTWCLITQLSDEAIEQWKINIHVRKGNLIAASAINWEVKKWLEIIGRFDSDLWIWLLSSNDEFFVGLNSDNWKYYIWTTLKNIWNVPLQVKVKYKIDANWFVWALKWAIFGVDWDFPLESFESEYLVEPWESKVAMEELSNIPIVWLWLNSSVNLTYSPSVDYDSDYAEKKDMNNTTWESVDLKFRFNILPANIILFVLWVIIVLTIWINLINSRFKKKKKGSK